MILESIAIDFRCGSCGMIRRVDARLSGTVVSYLPTGWKVFNKPRRVCCHRCVDNQGQKIIRTTLPPKPRNRSKEQIIQADPEGDQHRRADAQREKMKDIRMSTQEHVTLDPPPKIMSMPAVSGICPYCKMAIGDEDADWRADPESVTTFVKIHTRCFRERAQVQLLETSESDME